MQHAGSMRPSSFAGGASAAIFRFTGFVEENLIGQTTHGSSKK
jgi:hypothetical protein